MAAAGDGAEVTLKRQSLQSYSDHMLVPTLLFMVLAVQPFWEQLAHLRKASAAMTALGVLCVLVVQGARRAGDSELHKNAWVAESICLVTRLLSHVACVACDGGRSHLFLKMVSMWWMPIGSVRSCDSKGCFLVYICLQTVLTILRFQNDWESGGPWIVSTLVINTFLLDLATQREDRSRLRKQLRGALTDLEQIAQETTRSILAWLCDAAVTVSDDLRLLEPAPQLADLLGISGNKLQGRSLSSLVHRSDLERFEDHMRSVGNESHLYPQERARTAPYIQVKLVDAYAQQVSVHLFHASFAARGCRPTHVIGMSETWMPAKKRQVKSSQSTSFTRRVSHGSGEETTSAIPPSTSPSAHSSEKELPPSPPRSPTRADTRDVKPESLLAQSMLGLQGTSGELGARYRRHSPRPAIPAAGSAATSANTSNALGSSACPKSTLDKGTE